MEVSDLPNLLPRGVDLDLLFYSEDYSYWKLMLIFHKGKMLIKTESTNLTQEEENRLGQWAIGRHNYG
ncbi:MAG: hypothetical protein K0S09_2019 [Sphingobacteriaceae bacterium]|nr:hypothetical protein [Sphingobacteriaceae bacterium]